MGDWKSSAIGGSDAEVMKSGVSKCTVLFDILPDLGQVFFHSFRIFVFDNFLQDIQFLLNACDLMRCARVEKDFRQ